MEEIRIEYGYKKSILRVVTFKAEEELIEKIDSCMKREGLTHRSEFIRRAIKFYMEVQGCA